MQEAVTLFPHSISHSNNGDRLISIEFLPLFNRFTVLFELSKHASKASFSNSGSSPFHFSLWSVLFGLRWQFWGGKKCIKYGQFTSHFWNVKENTILWHTFILGIRLTSSRFLKRKSISCLILHTQVAEKQNEVVSSNVTSGRGFRGRNQSHTEGL